MNDTLYLSYLLQQLKPYIVSTSVGRSVKTCPARIELIDEQDAITTDRTWLGSGKKTEEKLKALSVEAGSIIFISDYSSDCCPPDRSLNATFICVDCSFATLHNIINDSIYQIRSWTDQLYTAADQSLYNTLTLSSLFSSAPIVLLNPEYRIVLSSRLEESTILAEQLADSGALPEEIVKELFKKEGKNNLPVRYVVPGSRLALYGLQIFHDENLISVLLLEVDSERTDIDFLGLCACIGRALYHHIIPSSSLRLGKYTKKFKDFWIDIMSQKLGQSFEIIQELKQLPFPAEAFVRVLVVAFKPRDGEQTPYNYVLAELREVFPDCNMTVYENEIVILKTHCERCFSLDLDTKRLNDILERHNGYIGISNGTRNYGTLRSLYLLARNIIQPACELNRNPDERILFYEDWWIYLIIDMCAHRFFELHNHDDIVYLIHPAIIHITRYDREHNTNLRDTLFYYLLNDRNLVKTANVTSSHRNTVINKVNKINKLINLDLEDGVLRQRLIFSCQVINYYEKYMKKQLKI